MSKPIPLSDVVSQFKSLKVKGSNLGFNDGGSEHFPKRRYVASVFNRFGRSNHFQGLVRKGSDFFISGGFPPRYETSGADLIKMTMGSTGASPGPIGSNMDRRRPPSEDKVLFRDQLDTTYWHPGGIGLMGNIMAVPLEGNGKSIIRFYDVDDITDNKLKRLGGGIDRPTYKAGAACMTMLPNDHYLLAVWTDSDKLTPVKRLHLDFYISKEKSVEGDWVGPISFFPEEGSEMHHKFQSMSLVWQGENKLEKLFLMNFENTASAAPLFRGDNIGRLFEVRFPDSWLDSPTADDVPEIIDVDKKTFNYHRKWCNMDAGSSAYIDNMKQLCVYSCYHFRKRGIVRCVEFRATTPMSSPR